MSTVRLVENTAKVADAVPACDAAKLAAEICARLVEWRDLQGGAEPVKWLLKTGAAFSASPEAAWLYVRFQTGDVTAIGESFESRAKHEARSRQATQQVTASAMKKLAAVEPELAAAMRQTYESVSPEAHAERYRQACES